MNKIVRYFDKLEDRIRGRLSRYPIIYSIIGGTAIVLFWRGVWVTADYFAGYYVYAQSPDIHMLIDGILSLISEHSYFASTGLFVSFFVSDQYYSFGH
jgi:hypothetical protein